MARLTAYVVFGLLAAGLLAVTVWPRLDLIVSGLFYNHAHGFFLTDNVFFNALHISAVKGAWILGFALAAMVAVSLISRRFGLLSPRIWLFLLLALLVGPALLANGTLKDHWGRARPAAVQQFGGTAVFSPALVPQPDAKRNGSFISGDGSFGFYLTCFAYAVPLTRRRLSRGLFWGGMAAGGVYALSRIAMGSHFLSDNLFAAVLMLATNAVIHMALFGARATRDYWRVWLGLDEPPPNSRIAKLP